MVLTSEFQPAATIMPVLVDRLYDQTMGLLEDARDYALRNEPDDRLALPTDDRFRLMIESMRTTSRLISVLAWIMARRAEVAGEDLIDGEDLTLLEYYLEPVDDPDQRLPRRFRVIAMRAHDLFARIHRLNQTRH